jgi:hypothetical protein
MKFLTALLLVVGLAVATDAGKYLEGCVGVNCKDNICEYLRCPVSARMPQSIETPMPYMPPVGEPLKIGCSEITRRDLFAAAALAGIIAHRGAWHLQESVGESWTRADLMEAERNK